MKKIKLNIKLVALSCLLLASCNQFNQINEVNGKNKMFGLGTEANVAFTTFFMTKLDNFINWIRGRSKKLANQNQKTNLNINSNSPVQIRTTIKTKNKSQTLYDVAFQDLTTEKNTQYIHDKKANEEWSGKSDPREDNS